MEGGESEGHRLCTILVDVAGLSQICLLRLIISELRLNTLARARPNQGKFTLNADELTLTWYGFALSQDEHTWI